jgi:hypothetical protein
MLVSTLRWREEFKVDELLQEEFPQDVFGGVGQVFGHDKEGRPVTYVLYTFQYILTDSSFTDTMFTAVVLT